MNQGGEEIKNFFVGELWMSVVPISIVSCCGISSEFECEISIWVRRYIHFITEWARKVIIPNPPMYHFAFRCQYKLNQKIWNWDSTFQKDTKETPQLPDRRKPWLGLFKIFYTLEWTISYRSYHMVHYVPYICCIGYRNY